MTETMPAFGAERNVAIAKMLGWKWCRHNTDHHLVVTPYLPDRELHSEWEYCDAPLTFANWQLDMMPDYCGDDGDCFGLLVTMHDSGFTLHVGAFFISVQPAYDDCISAYPPPIVIFFSESDGLRDAITQAAWLALSAAKESK